jgi:hypothetical protein
MRRSWSPVVLGLIAVCALVGAPLATVSVVYAAPNQWATKAPMPTARGGLGFAAASNGKLYAVGGSDTSSNPLATVEEYDPATTNAPCPSLTSINPASVTATSPAFTLVVAGTNFFAGSTVLWNGSARQTTYVSATQLDALITAADIAVPGAGHVTVVNPGPGGLESNGLTLGIQDSPGTWTTKAPMPTARVYLGLAAASNGKLYAVGGENGGLLLATVEEYNPATNTWATKAPMPTARAGLGFAAAGNGKLYAVGGGIRAAASLTRWRSTTRRPTPGPPRCPCTGPGGGWAWRLPATAGSTPSAGLAAA